MSKHGRVDLAREQASRPEHDQSRRWMFCFVINVLLLLAIALLRGIVFETSDDYNLMLSISGEKTGSPFWQLTFFNVPYAFLISRLYGITNAVQWYSLIQVALICLSLTVILFLLHKRLISFGFSSIQAVFLYGIVFFSLFLYPAQRLQFTTTAAVLGAASCACFFSLDTNRDSLPSSARFFAVGTLFLCLSLIERKSTGLCTLVFVVAGIVRTGMLLSAKGLLRDGIKCLLRMTPALVISVMVCAGFLVVHMLILAFGPNASYMEYDEWRVKFQDYPHPTYDEATELYEGIGWSEDQFILAQSLIYIDEGINRETFMTIMQSDEAIEKQSGIFSGILDFLRLHKHYPTAKTISLFLLGNILFIAIVSLSSLKRRRSLIQLILSLGSLALCMLFLSLVLYLSARGRWVLRAYQVISLPFGIALCFLTLDVTHEYLQGFLGRREERPPRIGRHAKIPTSAAPLSNVTTEQTFGLTGSSIATLLSALAMCVVLIGMGIKIEYSGIKALRARDKSSIEQLDAIEMYASSHPNDLFVHDYSVCNIYNSEDPFRVRGFGGVSNLVLSGGSYTYTACWQKQLRINGYDTLDGGTLLEPNVYYITDVSKGGNYSVYVRRYLASRYGDVIATEVATLKNNVKVIKFELVQ